MGLPLVVGVPSAWAGGVLPTNGKYVAGTGAISKKGANGLTVNQNGSTGIIDWSSFSIGKGNAVQFNNGAGATLNRVTGGDLSTIAGSLKATGSLYLINPQGVIVSGTGKVVTGGSFIASSRDMSDSDFTSGKRKFSGTSDGTVTNAGTIKSTNGDVTLIGSSVSNSGNLSAKNGTASLNAGNQVLLAPAGSQILVSGGAGSAANSGTLQAAQAQINAAGGNVYALAGNNGGIVRATGTSTINGHVWLTSGSGNVEVSGKIAATNADGSGGAVTARANNIVVSGSIDASATKSTMLGGNVSVVAADTTDFSGTIAARGGDRGKGGSVETSGEHLHVAGSAKVDTLSKDGLSGDWLLDPNDFTIAANGGDITGAALSAELGTTNVTISSNNGAQSGNGDIFVNDNVTWASSQRLVLVAARDVNINAVITSEAADGFLGISTGSSGSGDLHIALGRGRIAFPGVADGYIYALQINGKRFTMETSFANLVSDFYNGGDFALADNMDASTAGVFTSSVIDMTFFGTLEGLGNTISNIKIDATSSNSNGIGFIHGVSGLDGGTVRNLRLTNINIEERPNGVVSVGGVAGFLTYGSTISNVAVDGVINSYGSVLVGGLVGEAQNSTIESSSANVTISMKGGGTAGGLVGWAFGASSIENSSTFGAVTISSDSAQVIESGVAGGFVGVSSSAAMLSGDYATGAVSLIGVRGYAGGFLGEQDAGGITSTSYATGAVSIRDGVPTAVAGGFVGSNAGAIDQAYETGAVTGSQSGAFAGVNTGSIGATSAVFFNASANSAPGVLTAQAGSTNNATGLTLSQMEMASSFSGWTFGGLNSGANWALIDRDGSVNNAAGATGGTTPMLLNEYSTTVTNAHQLQLAILDPTANYVLGNDIDTSGTGGGDVWGSSGFVPIDQFSGTLNGGGHAISNLYINDSDGAYVGLIGRLNAGEIENLSILDTTISASSINAVVGGAAAQVVNGDLRSVTVTGNVTVGIGAAVGGLVGVGSGTIEDSSADIAISGNASAAGGIAGSFHGDIASTFATASISSSDYGAFLGGLVGELDGNITSSYAAGSVSGTGRSSSIGGLVGLLDDSATISSSYATASVTGSQSMAGGLVGVNNGAIVGSYATGSVTDASNTYDGPSSEVGGLVGLNAGSIANSYATGNISIGLDSVDDMNVILSAGGLVGVNDGILGASIQDSYATGHVIAGSMKSQDVSSLVYVGGFVGYNEGGTIDQSYSLGQAEGDYAEVGDFVGYNTGTIGGITAVYFNADFGGLGVGAGNAIVQGGGLARSEMRDYHNFDGWAFGTAPGASGWVIVDTDGSLNNSGGDGGTTPMLLNEYSTTIANVHELQLMQLDPSANYVLANNIDAVATASHNDVWGTAGFIPVAGNGNPSSFTGTFDGADHAISNLFINSASEYVGMFGRIAGAVHDVVLSGLNISGGGSVGGLAGRADGAEINNVYAEGDINGVSDVGGLVGALGGNSAISYSGADINLNGTGDNNGGLAGIVENGSSITQSYASGFVNGYGVAGGLVGENDGTISFSYSTANISSSANYAGGIAGVNLGTITNVYSIGTVDGPSAGGLVGNNSGDVESAFWSTSQFPYMPNSAFGTDSGTSSNLSGLSTSDMHTAANFTGWSFGGLGSGAQWVLVDRDGSINNAGAADGATSPMLLSEYSTSISSGHQLQLMELDLTADYTLNTDIALSDGADVWTNDGTSEGFVSVGGNAASTFDGSLDGKGHTIYGLFQEYSSVSELGLFGATGQSASISDLSLNNFNITQWSVPSVVGALVGSNAGTISHVSLNGTLTATGQAYIGPVAGFNSGKISDAQASIVIDAIVGDSTDQAAGGLVGYNVGEIRDSSSSGNINGYSDLPVGGLVGINGSETGYTGLISDSHSAVFVSAGSGNAGGLVGSDIGGKIESSYATGEVSGSVAYGGGLVGFIDANGSVTTSYASGNVTGYDTNSVVGGFVGDNEGAISQSFATGNATVLTDGAAAGGFAGVNNGSITDAYAMGDASADYAGGFVGRNAGTINTSYSLGIASGVNAGGFAGVDTGTTNYSYWNTDTSGISVDSPGGGSGQATGVSAAQFLGFLPTGFDNSIWAVVSGESYAYLRWQFGNAGPTPVSGTVYSDDGVTKVGAGYTVSLLSGGENIGDVVTYADGSFYKLLSSVQSSGLMASRGYDGAAYSDSGSYSGMKIYGSGLRISTPDALFSMVQKNIAVATGSGDQFYDIAQRFGDGKVSLSVNDGYSDGFDIDAALDVGLYDLDIKVAGALTESGTGQIIGNTLTGEAASALLTGHNTITQLGDFETGGTFSLSNLYQFTVSGDVDAGAGAITLGTDRNGLTINGSLRTAGTVTLNSAASITQAANAVIMASTLTGSAVGSVTLTQANLVGTLGPFTASGLFQFTDAQGLVVGGAVTTGGAVLKTTGAGHNMSIKAALSGPTVTLTSAGTIAEGSTGTIGAGTLTGTSVGAATLTASNFVGTLGAFTAGGVLQFTDAQGMVVGGPVTSTGGTFLKTTGAGHNMSIKGTLKTNSGSTSLISAGTIAESSTGIINSSALTGSSVGAATLTASNLIGTLSAFTAGGVLQLTNAQNLAIGGALSTQGAVLKTTGSGHSLSIGATISGSAITLTSAGTIAQSSAGVISASSLTGSAIGTATLTAANHIGTLGAFTASGLFQFTDAQGLVVGGALTTGGTILRTTGAGHNMSIKAALKTTTGTTTLVSGGTIAQASTGAITTTTLTGSSAGAATLTAANRIATLGSFTAGGNFALTDAQALTVAGPLSATPTSAVVSLTTTAGNLAFTGKVNGATVTLNTAGQATQSTASSITTNKLNVTAKTGINLVGANHIKAVGTRKTTSGPNVIKGIGS